MGKAGGSFLGVEEPEFFWGAGQRSVAPNVQGGGFRFDLRAEVDRNPEAGEVSADAERPGSGRGRRIY